MKPKERPSWEASRLFPDSALGGQLPGYFQGGAVSGDLEHINSLLDELSLAQITLDPDNLLELTRFLRQLEEFGSRPLTPEAGFITAKLIEAASGLVKGQAADYAAMGELLGQGLSLIQETVRDEQISPELPGRLEGWARALTEASGLAAGPAPTPSEPETPAPAAAAIPKAGPPAPEAGENAASPANSPPLPSSGPPLAEPPQPEARLSRLIEELSGVLDKMQITLVSMEQSHDPVSYLKELGWNLRLLTATAGFLDLRKGYQLSLELWGLIEDVQAEHVIYGTQVADLLIDGSSKIAELVKDLRFEGRQIRESEACLPQKEFNELLSRILAARQGLNLGGQPAASQDNEDEPPQKLGEILVKKGAVSVDELSRLMRSQNEKRSQKLGDLLLEAGLITAEDLKKALEIQKQRPGDKIGEILISLGVIEPDLIDKLLRDQEVNRETRLGELLVSSKIGRTAEVAGALREQRKAEGQLTGSLHMVKVETRKLDGLIDLVGELVIAQSLINPEELMGRAKDQKLIKNLAQVTRITSDLQRNAMGLRMVQVRSTFQKMQRLTRDLSRRLDKTVELNMIGADTEIDRNMVETIYDPLVHMIRNAMDHGIESAEERRAAGKPSCGYLTLKAYHQGGNVIIELADDGQGLNADKIRAKALAGGLIGPGDTLSDQAAYNLIFHPGFSTSNKVTDISGRGLGMGVVRRAIEQLRGKVDLSSTPGRSTTVTIRLPLTLAIIDGMIVRVGENRYILPTVSINESFRPKNSDFFTVKNQGEVIKVRNQLVPLLRLGDVVEDPAAGRDPAEALVVVVENEGQRRCLMVDEVIGKQEVVIKSLGERLKHVKTLAGGTILGDGRVGLILDVAGLFAISSGLAAANSGLAGDLDDDWGMEDPETGPPFWN